MKRPGLPGALYWPAAIVATEAVYVAAFLRPYGLLDHYETPGLDLGKLGGYTVEAGWGFLAAMVLLFALYALAFRRALSEDSRPLPWIIGGGLLFAVTAAAVYPIGAQDVFDNLFYGHMAAVHGANPLLTAPEAFQKDDLYQYVAWYWWPIPYGPIWAVVDALVSRLTGSGVLAGLIAFKALNVAFYAACLGLLAGILRRLRPAYLAAGLLLFAWSPLVILEGMANAHNDLALMALILAAILLLARGRVSWGLAALLASVLVKFVSLPLLPIYLIAAWRGAADRRRFAASAAMLLLAAAIALYLPYYTPGDEWQALAARPFHQAELFTTSLPAMASFALDRLMPKDRAQTLVRDAAMGAWGLYVLWETWRAWRRRAARDAGTLAAAFAGGSYRILLFFLLFACLWFQPWYLVWLLVLAPLLAPGAQAAALIVFSALVQLKYFVFDFAWFWRSPMDELLVPEVAATALIFVPVLALYGWLACRGRRQHA